MKTKNLAILAIVAAALVAVAKFTSDGGRAKKPAVSGEPVFPALDAGAVAAMEISGGAGTVRVELGDYGWAVTNAFGYPADIVRLREAILALADLKIGHRQPDMSIDSSSAASVALFAADGAPLAKLLLGGSRESAQQEQTPYGMMGGGADGRYIAREGSPDVFLVKENLSEFAADPKQWIDSQLLSVQASEVARIVLTAPDGATVAFDRSSGKLEMEGLADGEEFDSSKSYGLESAFAYLRLADVADPALDDAATGLADGTASLFAVTTGDGVTYSARVGAEAPGGAGRYARLAIDPGTNAVPAELAAKSALFQRFTYVIPSYFAQNLTRTRADLVKEAPAPAEEPPAEAAPAEEPAEAPAEAAPAEPAAPETPAESAAAEAPAEAGAPAAEETAEQPAANVEE